MNKQRRDELTNALVALEAARGTVEQVLSEEQDSFDNLPEALQQAPNGEQIQEAISSLEEVINHIDEAISSLDAARE